MTATARLPRFTTGDMLPFHSLGSETLREARYARMWMLTQVPDLLRLAERVGGDPFYIQCLKDLREALKAPDRHHWGLRRWADAGLWPHQVRSDPINRPVTVSAPRVKAAMSEVWWMLDSDPSSHARLMSILFDPEPVAEDEGTVSP